MQYPHTHIVRPSSNLIFHTALQSILEYQSIPSPLELDQLSQFKFPTLQGYKSSQKPKSGKCHLPTSPTDRLTSTSTSTSTLTQSVLNPNPPS